ncbi:16S rRNA (guanine(527)-N(7))-methyltransferase RsmG [Desulfatiferula olefinivorans]
MTHDAPVQKKQKPMAVRSAAWMETLQKGLAFFSVRPTPVMLEQLAFHAAEMLFWNKKTNLTAITDPYEVAVKHMIDSAAALSIIPPSSSVLDLGSGGGFPGLPLKILCPSLSVTLVDASRKKVSFLKHVIRTRSLKGIEAHHGRGEDLACDPTFRGAFDVVISRAFSGLDVFVPMALPFLRPDGRIIAMKGKDIDQEERLFDAVAGTLADGSAVTARDLDLTRTLYTLPFIASRRAFLVIGLKK